MTNDKLRQQLLEIHNRHGRLDPADVVDEARGDTSPLHRYFLWDDTAAAAQYRLDQARGLIRRVRIDVIDTHQQPIRVRAFVNVDEGGEEESRAYRPLADVAADDDLRDQVLDEARRELRRLQVKYSSLGAAFTALLREHLEQDAA